MAFLQATKQKIYYIYWIDNQIESQTALFFQKGSAIMYQLSLPLVGLHTLTGEFLNAQYREATKHLSRSEDLTQKQQQRMDLAFQGKRLDFLPIDVDTRWWFAEHYHDGTLESAVQDCDLDKILMCSPLAAVPPAIEPIPGIEIKEHWEGEPVRYQNGGYPGRKRSVTIHTPVGSVTAAEAYASRSFGIVEYPVKEVEDLQVVRYIYEQRAQHAKAVSSAADWCAPLTPIQTLIVQLAGIETTSFLLADEPEETEAFMDFLDEVHRPVIEFLAKERKMVFSVENYSADNSSGYFDQYLGPQLQRRSQIAQKYGADLGVHHDGKLQPLFGRLQEVGVTYANGITAAPSGDVELEDIRAIAGDRMVLKDIIPQSIFMDSYDIGAFKEYIARAAELFRADHRVILGIGDMLPCTSDLKRLEIMVDMITKLTR